MKLNHEQKGCEQYERDGKINNSERAIHIISVEDFEISRTKGVKKPLLNPQILNILVLTLLEIALKPVRI